MGQFGQLDLALADSGEIVIGQPFGGIAFQPQRQLAGAKCFEHHARATKILDGDLVEIVQTAVEGQILAPPSGVLAIGDRLPRLGIGHHIRARTDRCLEACLVNGPVLPLRLLQDRAQAKDQRQFTVLGVEGKLHRTRTGRLGRCNLFPRRVIARAAQRAERFK